MVFGRKKKEEQEVIEDAAANPETDLAVAYGNGEEANDDVSLTDSVPPPPPTGEENNTKNEGLFQEESPTESPSVGVANDADHSMNEKKEGELIKRKKLLLIASCLISFIILLALAIKYGQVRSQAAEVTAAEELESTSVDPVATQPPTIVVQETPAPSTNTTDAAPIEEGPFAGCVANEISVLTTCVNGNDNVRGASAAIKFCVEDEVTDQFWAWVSTPARVRPQIANDWAWMRAGEEAEIPFLPEGEWVIGLFAEGEQQMLEYPLLNSTVFTINCPLPEEDPIIPPPEEDLLPPPEEDPLPPPEEDPLPPPEEE